MCTCRPTVRAPEENTNVHLQAHLEGPRGRYKCAPAGPPRGPQRKIQMCTCRPTVRAPEENTNVHLQAHREVPRGAGGREGQPLLLLAHPHIHVPAGPLQVLKHLLQHGPCTPGPQTPPSAWTLHSRSSNTSFSMDPALRRADVCVRACVRACVRVCVCACVCVCARARACVLVNVPQPKQQFDIAHTRARLGTHTHKHIGRWTYSTPYTFMWLQEALGFSLSHWSRGASRKKAGAWTRMLLPSLACRQGNPEGAQYQQWSPTCQQRSPEGIQGVLRAFREC